MNGARVSTPKHLTNFSDPQYRKDWIAFPVSSNWTKMVFLCRNSDQQFPHFDLVIHFYLQPVVLVRIRYIYGLKFGHHFAR